MSTEESKLYLGQEPNCKASDPKCENLEENYEKSKYNRQSLYSSLGKNLNKAKDYFFNKVGSKSDVYWSKKMDKTFAIVIVVSIIYIAVLLSNVFNPPPYEKTTNYSFFYGMFTLLFIIFFFSVSFAEEKMTMFERMITWSEETINDWKIEMQKGTLNAYGKKYSIVTENGDEVENKIEVEDGEKKSILKRIYDNITGIFSIFNDNSVKEKKKDGNNLKNTILGRNVKTVNETYAHYTTHNVIISLNFLIVIYFVFFNEATSGQWWMILFYPLVLFVYFYHLTYWFMFYTSSFEKRDEEEQSIVGTDWKKIGFWLLNISINVVCVSLFITVLFQHDALASWSLFSMLVFIGMLILSTIEGETLKDKLHKFSEMHSTSFQYLTSLVIYMLCFVYFFATPSTELPPQLKYYYKSLYNSLGSAFVENFYSYIFFPLTIILAVYLFLRAIFSPVIAEHGKDVDYNAIRIRYVIIYFLCFVFFCTLYFHQSKIPCYAQVFFNSAGIKSKIIFNTIIALFVFGFLLTFAILYSPQDTLPKTDTAVTENKKEQKDNANASIFNKFDVKQIVRLIVLLIICILIVVAFTLFWMKNSALLTQLYKGNKQDWADTKANNGNENLRNLKTFIILTPIIGILFLLYFIVTFFNSQAVANSSKNLVSTFSQIFFILGFIGVFTCISILVVYTLIMQKPGTGINIATYVILFIMFFLIYKILVSTSVVQQNPVYKLLVEMFFIIPCLFELYVLPHILNSTVGKYALQTYKTTKFNTTATYVTIFVLLVSIIIIRYIFYPLTLSQSTMFVGFLLLNGPVSIYNVNSPISYNTITLLNSKYSTYNDNSGNYSNNFIPSNYQNSYNYSISFWFNIANNQTVENEQPLVSFGNVPQIVYVGDTSSLSISFLTSSDDDTNTIITIPNIKLQKWSFVAINMDGGTVDVFIDNYLINSTEGVIPYVDPTNSDITVGYNAMNTEVNTSSLNNTFSQVCNFVYYPHTLTITNIADLYSEGKNLDPPINSVNETGKELTPFDMKLHELDRDFHAIKDTFECSYVDFLTPTPDACNNIIDNDDYFDNYLSLPWYFLHLGDDTTGKTETTQTTETSD